MVLGMLDCVIPWLSISFVQYEETSFSTPEYENVQFAPPANEVEELYGQLAERKCIEIPRQSIR